VYGRERTGYTAVRGPCTVYTGVFTFTAHERGTFTTRVHDRAQTVYTAVHGPCTRPFTGRVHGPFMTRTRPCTLYPGCLRPVYAAVHGGYEPGTRPYMIRVPCTRSSLRPVYTAVYGRNVRGRERTGYTAVYGPCTRPCTGRIHGREQPCTRSTAVFTVRTRGTRP